MTSTGTRTRAWPNGAPPSTKHAAYRRFSPPRLPTGPGSRSSRCAARPGSAACSPPAVLRDGGKTRAHLPCLAEGAKAVPHERRRSRDAATRLIAELEAIAAAAEDGMKQHDRWLLARTLLLRKLDGRRSTSRLPELIEFVLSRPLISAGMIAKELGVTPRAAQNPVAELGLREATGRGRYRAWGVL
jgi:hypothetical protein